MFVSMTDMTAASSQVPLLQVPFSCFGILACVSSGGILAEHPKSIGNHCIATAVYPTAPETPQQL